MAFARLTNLMKASKADGTPENIFSDEEVKEIYTKLTERDSKATVRLQSQEGLRTGGQVARKLEQAIEFGTKKSEPERFTTLTDVAKDLDIKREWIENIFPFRQDGDAWVRSGDVILTSHGYYKASKAFLDQLEVSAVHTRTFCEENQLSYETMNLMLDQYRNTCQANPRLSEYEVISLGGGQHIFTKKFRDQLRQIISDKMDRVTQTTTLSTTPEDGLTAPSDLTLKLAEEVVRRDSASLRGRIWMDGSLIKFTPSEQLLADRDILCQEIKNGTRDFLGEADVAHLDIEKQGFQKFVVEALHHRGIAFSEGVISFTCFQRTVDTVRRILDSTGAVSVPGSEFHLKNRDILAFADAVFDRMIDGGANVKDVHRTGRHKEHFIRDSFQESVGSEVIRLAEAQANGIGKRSSASKVSWPLIVDTIQKAHNGVSDDLISSLLTPSLQSAATNAYASTISLAHRKNQSAFNTFWSQKCLARTRLYLLGVSTVRDARLKVEMQKTTLQFLVQRLIPESIKTAEESDYLHGRAHVRVVDILERRLEDLEANLSPPPGSPRMESSKVDLSSDAEGLEDALAAFSRAVGVAAPDRAALKEAKTTYIQDLIRSIDNEAEPARLFLKLVLILLACKRKGILHATGRFAPRLTKELTGEISSETHDWLKKVRDAARSGEMTLEDRERANESIQQAFEDWQAADFSYEKE